MAANLVIAGETDTLIPQTMDIIINTCIFKGEKKIIVPEKSRKGNGKFLVLKGASGNNLKEVELKIPLAHININYRC